MAKVMQGHIVPLLVLISLPGNKSNTLLCLNSFNVKETVIYNIGSPNMYV